MMNFDYDDDEGWLLEATGIERAISAPPVMDSTEKIAPPSIFAFQSKYSHLFGDIRYEEDYEDFYKSSVDPSRLPAPLSTEFLVVVNDKKKVSPNVTPKRGEDLVSKIVDEETHKSKIRLNFDDSKVVRKSPGKERLLVKSPTTSVGSKSPREDTLSPTEGLSIGGSPRDKSPRSKGKYSMMSEVIGKIYSLSKDQYGCRFLQKKLEENKPEEVEVIFGEIFEHIVELMTDPFGNYLCQKLLEHVDEKQKTLIIKTVSSELVGIATNMHGTRAVQKLIECLNTAEQIRLVTAALKSSVVTLIRDLNGNHVIQRCLQKLTNVDKQFIYDAITGKCVQVATHKHGCCVLQRSIDFASDKQKMQLVNEVIAHALQLVQDPFGNYVVQYVLDLAEEQITGEIIKKFLGSIDTLSINKFSSNVIEQCIRLAPVTIRHKMIDEILTMDKLEAILQDSFGNYVIQTAIGECDARQFASFNEIIKPMLPNIKSTPYGKKIEAKLAKHVQKKPGDTKTFAKKQVKK